jgi:NitT/TauT family transport system substrate-binding protein
MGWLRLALTTIALAWLSAPGAAQELKKIKVTIPVPVIVFYPLVVAQEQGFFKKEGLDVEVISTNGDGPDVDALISGSVQFTVSTPNRLFMAAEQGKRLLAVMNLAERMSIDCAMNKDVADRLKITASTPLDERLKLLKGLTVAGTRPGSFTYLMLVGYARRAGLVPQKDVQVIGVGGLNAMLPALENGQIAVGCTGSPMPELAVSRGKAIMFTNNAAGGDPSFNDFLYEMVYALPEYVKAEPDTTRRFLRALVAATNAVVEKPSVEQLPSLRARYTGLSDEMLVSILDALKPGFSRTGTVTKNAVDKAGAFLVDTGVVAKAASFEEVADNSYLPKP